MYFLNDPFAQHRNLLFPGCGAGANVLVPPGPACDDPNPRLQADQLLPFYDRSTRTLILRPAVPLRQETRYAVILTSRLQDAQGRAVVPPGPGINHPAQDGELSPVLGRLPRGVRVEDIAFTWAFTTQSTTRDLEALQLGLHVRGPLALLGVQYPPALSPIGWLATLPGAGRTATRSTSPSAPGQPPLPAPGIAGSGATSSTLLLNSLAVPPLPLSAAGPRLTQRLDEVSASWRPMPFLSLLERPG